MNYIFLAYLDEHLYSKFAHSNVFKIVRFVDDFFLVISDKSSTGAHFDVEGTLTAFRPTLAHSQVTNELPLNGSIKFLDLYITFCSNHAC